MSYIYENINYVFKHKLSENNILEITTNILDFHDGCEPDIEFISFKLNGEYIEKDVFDDVFIALLEGTVYNRLCAGEII